MSGVIGQCAGVARVQVRFMKSLKIRKVLNLDNAPDPYRKDNITFNGFRDGMVQVGNGFRKQNKGIE
jgi:hypothetical protein